MFKAVIGLTLLTLCAGCVTMPKAERWVFDKPGVAEAARKRDESQCFAAAIDAGATDRASMMKMDRPAYRACMERRGYTLQIEQ